MSGVSEVEKNSVDLLPNPMTEDDLADFTCELPDADRTAAGVCVLTNQPTNQASEEGGRHCVGSAHKRSPSR